MKELDPNCVRVVLVDMPTSVHGFIVSDGFDFYTVVLNPRLSKEMQTKTYFHEISHITNGDFSRMQDINRDLMESLSADQIENIRHE